MQARLHIVHAVYTVNFNLDVECPDPIDIPDAMLKSGDEILRKAEGIARVATKPVLLIRGQ